MGKAKKGKGSSSSTAAAKKTCTCDDPYKCSCGNRPERPSRGHKWDPEKQEWGGKGHKQKGASGQTSAVGKQASTTSVGKTQVAQWQKLPTALLREFCQRQKRPLPKFKALSDTSKKSSTASAASSSSSSSSFKFRCIVPDSKDTKKDIIIIPANPVENEEQAKEESALLALLHLTPSIPHERKLPEPYKTTWLAAIAAQKQESKKNANNSNSNNDNKTNNDNTGAGSSKTTTATQQKQTSKGTNGSSASATAATAVSNTNLTLASSHVLSIADKRKRDEEKRKQRNARIQKHEAIRLANKNPPVFLSATLRKQIEQLLRDGTLSMTNNIIATAPGTTGSVDDDDDDETPSELNEYESDVQAYVESRLHQEGFTKRQARTSFLQQQQQQQQRRMKASNNTRLDDETQWEKLYDDCLQWLCVNLSEDQLPEGIHQRGQTLDFVIAPGSSEKKTKNSSTTTTNKVTQQGGTGTNTSTNTNTREIGKQGNANPKARAFANTFGLTVSDAEWILSSVEQQQGGTTTAEDKLWEQICQLAGVLSSTETVPSNNDESNDETIFEEEMEALNAIFPTECSVEEGKDSSSSTCIVKIDTPENLSISIFIDKSKYPKSVPTKVLISGIKWPEQVGVAFHVELVKFMSTLTLGEPMIFEIYSQVQELCQSIDMLRRQNLSLAPPTTTTTTATTGKDSNVGKTSSSDQVSVSSSTTATTMTTMTTDTTTTSSKRATAKTPKTITVRRRPRVRSVFWSDPPKKTPPSVPGPNINKSIQLQREGLPAAKVRNDFLSILEQSQKASRVVLVTGDTGSGKTTQIPQFILEENPKTAKIVVAQPRRLAATGVAGRVAQERGETQPGTGSVGYIVRGDTKVGNSTRLLFCTFGILLRQLQSNNALDCITHIVIDEVHERTLDGDVLMAILKRSLPKLPHLTVVLMSATLDAARFAAYWGDNTPRIHIPGRTFPVQDYMLEEVLDMTGYIPPKKGKKKSHFNSRNSNHNSQQRRSSPWNDSEKSDEEEENEEEENDDVEDDGPTNGASTPKESAVVTGTVSLEEKLRRIDQSNVEYDLLGRLVKSLIQQKAMGNDGSILVFLPGVPEINQARTIVEKITRGLPILLLSLHGGLQPKEQNLVFSSSKGLVKVILSTNVAETSITIPDCTIVIDSCLEKVNTIDEANRMPILQQQLASKASLKQRRGRAGRVREGKCYKLVSKGVFHKLKDHSEPEITRCALDQTMLSLLFLGLEEGDGSFLNTLLDPPSQTSISNAVQSLEGIGALERLNDIGNSNDYKRKNLGSSRLTPLGMHLAGIPAPPVVGKLLLIGSILGCRRAALAMAAGLTVGRSPFLRVNNNNYGGRQRNQRKGGDGDVASSIEEMKQQTIVENRSKLFVESGNSDHAMLAAAFINWESRPTGGGERRRYCESLGLSFNSMKDMVQLVNQYDSSLTSAGFPSSTETERNIKSWRILRACAVSAMAPGQLVRVHRPAAKYTDTAEGALEKDAQAKELKFFIRVENEKEDGSTDRTATSTTANSTSTFSPGPGRFDRKNEERVFIHPSSALFAVGNYNCPWLVYHSMVKTSKPFLRDVTECSIYAVLLFGGKMEVEARNCLIIIDRWVQLSASARIGALIRGLRDKMDELLERKVENPTVDISGTNEMNLIVKLLATDGLGS